MNELYFCFPTYILNFINIEDLQDLKDVGFLEKIYRESLKEATTDELIHYKQLGNGIVINHEFSQGLYGIPTIAKIVEIQQQNKDFLIEHYIEIIDKILFEREQEGQMELELDDQENKKIKMCYLLPNLTPNTTRRYKNVNKIVQLKNCSNLYLTRKWLHQLLNIVKKQLKS